MKQYKRTKRYVYTAMALATMGTLAMTTPVFAEDSTQGTNITSTTTFGVPGANLGAPGERQGGMMGRGKGMMKPGVFGTVSAVSGDTITVTSTSRKGPGPRPGDSGDSSVGTSTSVTTTFTVDATNAKITKNNAAGTIADIAVGDTIMAQGTLTGTNLVATVIRDGKMPMRGQGGENNGGKANPTQNTSAITGNGQPIVAGTVTVVSGSTITITNKSNVTYTIDATTAVIHKGPTTAVVSDIKVGDMIIAQGTINGSNVVATTVIDQSKPASTTTGTTPPQHEGGGFFGGVGSFFAHLFGF